MVCASSRHRSNVCTETPTSLETSPTSALSGGNNRATTRLLNAAPYRAILYPLRPQVLQSNEATTILTRGVLGAPVSNYDEAKRYLAGHFQGNIDLGAGQLVFVKTVLVLHQPLGGFAYLGKRFGVYDRIRNDTNLIIDPGHYTLDWMIAHGGPKGLVMMPSRSGSFAGGTSSIIRTIASQIAATGGGDTNSKMRKVGAGETAAISQPSRLSIVKLIVAFATKTKKPTESWA